MCVLLTMLHGACFLKVSVRYSIYFADRSAMPTAYTAELYTFRQ